jgi:predicted phage terminase large subunit-like protein
MPSLTLPRALDIKAQLRLIEKEKCERSLVEFIKRAWHIIEPGQPYIHNWHIDLISSHLEAITDEVILDDGTYYNRLLINVPPGLMKSLILNVFWPSWEWGPRNMPHLRYVCAAHQAALAIRDSTKMRRLIQSDWYRRYWGDRVVLTGDQNAKVKFENTATGFREAIAAGSITGARGDRVLIDDPHSVEGAASDAMRATTLEWFTEAVPTRLNNPDRSAIVVIMQRLHEEDVSGVILERKGFAGKWDAIVLPMRYESWRAAHPTKLGYTDARDTDGELLFEQRFPAHVVADLEAALGPFATAGQLQQSPTPRGGGIIKDEWWRAWPDAKSYPPIDFVLASLDTAYTVKQENDYSAMTVWGVFTTSDKAQASNIVMRDGNVLSFQERVYQQGAPNVIMMYAFQERLEFPDLVAKVIKVCTDMKVDHLLIENKASGISLGQELHRALGAERFGIQMVDPKNLDKLARLYSVQHIFSERMVWAPDKEWAEMVIRQVATFPKGKFDDLVDCTSQALRYLRDVGLLTRSTERLEQIERDKVYTGRAPEPLYPG